MACMVLRWISLILGDHSIGRQQQLNGHLRESRPGNQDDTDQQGQRAEHARLVAHTGLSQALLEMRWTLEKQRLLLDASRARGQALLLGPQAPVVAIAEGDRSFHGGRGRPSARPLSRP